MYPAGTAGTDGRCEPCPAGRHAAKTNQTSCEACGTAKHSSKPGQRQCTRCPKGKQPNEAKSGCRPCPDSEFFDASSTPPRCRSCPAGEQKKTNSTSCEACPPGKQNKKDAKGVVGACAHCGVGQQPAATRVGCADCSGPNVSSAITNYSCSTCPAGRVPDRDTRSQCELCVAGKFHSRQTHACQKCEMGNYSIAGTTACRICPKGEAPNSDATGCKACGGAQYFDTNTASCKSCAAGKQINGDGNGCAACTPGKATQGTANCTLCDAGYVPTSSGAECTPHTKLFSKDVACAPAHDVAGAWVDKSRGATACNALSECVACGKTNVEVAAGWRLHVAGGLAAVLRCPHPADVRKQACGTESYAPHPPRSSAPSDPSFRGCGPKYHVVGSPRQSSVAGVYSEVPDAVNGSSYFANNATGDSSRVLYWTPDMGGKWVIADRIGQGLRAVQPDGSAPTSDAPPEAGWLVWSGRESSWVPAAAEFSVKADRPRLGYTGLLCAVCAHGFYRSGPHRCSACNSESEKLQAAAALLVLLLLALGGLVFYLVRGRRCRRPSSAVSDDGITRESQELTLFESPLDSSIDAPEDTARPNWCTRVNDTGITLFTCV